MLSLDNLKSICPRARADRLAVYVGPLNDAMDEYAILKNVDRQAAFVAQIAHESGQFRRVVENLNYSAAGLRATWPSRFSAERAQQFARRPEAIANIVYADRMGNGSPESGDGWRYRGRGLIQITGHENYAACSTALFGYPSKLLNEPELLAQPDYACRSAAWYWKSRGLNALADAGDFQRITRRINGGMNGYADRVTFWERAKEVLA